jgi:hypothetical protein
MGVLDDIPSLSIAGDRAILAALKAFVPDARNLAVDRRTTLTDSSIKAGVTLGTGFISRRPTKFAGRDRSKSRFTELFADIEAHPWDIGFADPLEYLESEREEVFAHPYDKQDPRMTDEIWARIEKRAAKETVTGGIMGLPIAAHVTRMSIGFGSKTNLPLRYLAHYIKWHEGEEPFVQGKHGNEVIGIHRDSMASIRIYTLINAALWYDANKDWMPDVWWHEILKHTLKDPMYSGKNYKAMTTILNQAIGSIAPANSGWKCMFEPIDENLNHPAPTSYHAEQITQNDTTFYLVFQAEIQKSINDLADAGLIRTALMYKELLSATPTKRVLRLYTLLRSVKAWGGYSRGQDHLAHEEQFGLERSEHEAPPGEHPWGPYIKAEMDKFVRWAQEKSKFKSFQELVRTFLTALRAKGAGAKVSIEVDERVMHPNARGGRGRGRGRGRGKGRGAKGVDDDRPSPPRRFVFTDKTIVGLSDPYTPFAVESIVDLYTMENPGGVGVRNVPEYKNPRAINIIALAEFALSRMFGEPMNDYMFTDHETQNMGSGADFVAGKTTGVALFDDFINLYGSSRIDILLMNADYTAYDSTQGQVNSRVYQRDGLVKSLTAQGLDAPYGPWSGGMPEVVERLFGEGITTGIVFKSGTLPMGFFETNFPGRVVNSLSVEEVNAVLKEQMLPVRMIDVDSLRSGELITLASNTLNNRANFDAWMHKFDPKYMYLLRIRIQGDDSNLAYKMVPGAMMTVSRYNELVESFQAVSNGNGLLVKKEKFVMRFFFSEFLQVTSFYGVFCPKPIVQPFGSEKVSRTIGILDQVRSDMGKSATLVERGLPHDLMVRKLFWTFAWKRSIRDAKMRAADDSYFLPMPTLFLPLAAGGVGMLPWTILSPNAGTVIVAFLDTHPEWREMMERCAAIATVPIPNRRRDVARVMNSDSPLVSPIDPFKVGREYLRSTMPEARIRNSEVAYNWLLDNKIVDLGSKRYSQYPLTYLDSALAQNKNLRELDFESKTLAVSSMINTAMKGLRRPYNTDCEWVSGFTYEFLDEVDSILPSEITPFDAMDDKVVELHRRVGYLRSNELYTMRPARLLGILYQDPYFRRDIQEDDFVKLLSGNKILNSITAIKAVLVAVGARQDLATIVANMFTSSVARHSAMANLSGMSLNGPCLNSLDRSRAAVMRLVGPYYTSKSDISDLLLLQCASMSILHFFRTGKLQRVRPIIGKNSIQIARRHLLPAKLIGDFEELVVFAGVAGE